jgi:hypothetical protein
MAAPEGPFGGMKFVRLLFQLLSLACGITHAGVFVPAGAPRPDPAFLTAAAGATVKLDLILDAPLPRENRGRTTVYALGGKLAAPIGEQTGLLTAEPDKAGWRLTVSVPVPAARPGARFLVKTELLAPTSLLLGAIELRVPEEDIAADIRAFVATHPLQVLGAGKKLHALLANANIPFGHEASEGSVALTEDAGENPPGTVVSFGPAATSDILLVTAQRAGTGWKIAVQLPAGHDLANPEALRDLLKVFHFIHQLPTD